MTKMERCCAKHKYLACGARRGEPVGRCERLGGGSRCFASVCIKGNCLIKIGLNNHIIDAWHKLNKIIESEFTTLPQPCGSARIMMSFMYLARQNAASCTVGEA